MARLYSSSLSFAAMAAQMDRGCLMRWWGVVGWRERYARLSPVSRLGRSHGYLSKDCCDVEGFKCRGRFSRRSR